MTVSKCNTMLELPTNATKTDKQYYQEVSVPPITPLPPEKMKYVVPRMVKIRELLPAHQQVFPDCMEFNPIQSATFQVAYHSDENVLVCAPTGAGKTNIALLCILRELGRFSSIIEMKRADFKIVYVSPMKALAAEIVSTFGKQLAGLQVEVREFSGDMHLYQQQIATTEILVTTPEKWDNVTRKSTEYSSLFQSVLLLIIDEVHILNCDRGPVLEAIVARTVRLRKSNSSKIRIVGLSATLPNFEEVAQFLNVKRDIGLFYFNWGFRPVPLKQTFIGTKYMRTYNIVKQVDDVFYEKLIGFLKNDKQVLVFVHSRAKCITTADFLLDHAKSGYDANYFLPVRGAEYRRGLEMLEDANMRRLSTYFDNGIAIHHAGMLREDRVIVEKLFNERLVKVLISTATLAWGVNVPAYAVIIKGTRMYNIVKGCQDNINLVDVLQMFGRAGRPQFDEAGEAVLISSDKDLPYYLSLLRWHTPIESQFELKVVEHLNAEIVLGSVKSISDAIDWFKHTFCYIRMRNKLQSGFGFLVSHVEATLQAACKELIEKSVIELLAADMISYDRTAGTLSSKELGRIASHAYISPSTIKVISVALKAKMTIKDVLDLLSKAKEFEQSQTRQDELKELSVLNTNGTKFNVAYTKATELHYKVTVLLQSFFSRNEIKHTSLQLDQLFFVKNGVRILRAVFEMMLHVRIADSAKTVLDVQKALEHSCWPDDHPIYQCKKADKMSLERISLLGKSLYEVKNSFYTSRKSDNYGKAGRQIMNWLKSLPLIEINVICNRETPEFLNIRITIIPDFVWDERVNCDGQIEPFIVWVENVKTNRILVWDEFAIRKRQVDRGETITRDIPVGFNVHERNDIVVQVLSKYWLGIHCTSKIGHSAESKVSRGISHFPEWQSAERELPRSYLEPQFKLLEIGNDDSEED